jgi:hypothetical protein
MIKTKVTKTKVKKTDSEIAVIEANKQVALFKLRIEKIVITSLEDLEEQSTFLRLVKSTIKEKDEKRKQLLAPFQAGVKALNLEFKAPINALEEIEAQLKRKMLDYTQEQEKLRRIAQDKIDEKERRAREKAEKRAAVLIEKGQEEKAEKVMERTMVPRTIVQPIKPVQGLTTRSNWVAEIVNINLVPRDWLMADMSKLNAQAKASKNLVKIPGVNFVNKPIIAQRS